MIRRLAQSESALAGVLLVAMVLLPFVEILLRNFFGSGIPGSILLGQHLNLWIGFMGAAIAAKEGKLLTLATGKLLPEGRWRRAAQIFSAAVTAAISTLLCRGGIEVVQLDLSGEIALGIPIWVTRLILPVAFALIAVRVVWRAGDGGVARALASSGVVVGVLLSFSPQILEALPAWPGILLILVATVLGGPIFVAVGGIAVALWMSEGIPLGVIPHQAYDLTQSPFLSAIPLFTVAGFLFAEGAAARRLLRVSRALFGWVPGGTAVVCTVVCAFFTVFTGGSGVTILALGGLLFLTLEQDGYREKFSLGLLTASGSLGLLFPPALPLILYSVVAGIEPEKMFIGGILPGLLLLVLIGGWCIREGIRRGVSRTRFDLREVRGSIWSAKWELILPMLILFAYLRGYATLVETSAAAALYAFVVQCLFHRDVSIRRGLPDVLHRSVVLFGGVLIILAVAKGLSKFMVRESIPDQLFEWTQGHIESPIVFLLGLNVFLLIVGCFLDIFSATMVVVPLIIPIAAAYDVSAVHLGIIFVANMELGYLTPPVGMNLFLASYRFERPVMTVCRAALPMFWILAVGVLLITYIPILTTWYEG